MTILILADSLGLFSIFYDFFNQLINSPNSTLWFFYFPIVYIMSSTFYAVRLNVKSCNFQGSVSGWQYINKCFLPVIHSYDIQERCTQRI